MASKFFERRSLRAQMETYLESKGWIGLTWAEGFSAISLSEITPPFIGVMLDDLGRTELELGHDSTSNKTFIRRAQMNIYMESEDRVDALLDDISDFLDMEVIIIKDNLSAVLGSLISDTETIAGQVTEPILSTESNLQWQGVISCSYEAHYPQG